MFRFTFMEFCIIVKFLAPVKRKPFPVTKNFVTFGMSEEILRVFLYFVSSTVLPLIKK